MSERIVFCSKLDKEAPGLSQPPFSGELGQEIFERVSEEAWRMWEDDIQIKVINEYRLNLADPDQYQILLDQMKGFLNLSTGEQLEIEDPERGR